MRCHENRHQDNRKKKRVGDGIMTTELMPLGGGRSLALPEIFAKDEKTAERVLEFFTAQIRNPNTRRAYGHAVGGFADWCAGQGVSDLDQVRTLHVAAYVEGLQDQFAPPSVKLHLAAIRMLFDWLVVGQVIANNPAASVKGPKHSAKKGKTPVLMAEEASGLLLSIDISDNIGLRDRALIALMVYTFARVGAVLKMRVEDVYTQGRRTWVRLHEKGGKRHEMPCHHKLEEYLHAYMDDTGIQAEPKGYLFRSAKGWAGELSEKPLRQADVYQMIARRSRQAGIKTKIGCHSFRATGITEYLRAGGKLEIAQQMANHESARTTGLYDRRNDEVSLDEVERILI